MRGDGLGREREDSPRASKFASGNPWCGRHPAALVTGWLACQRGPSRPSLATLVALAWPHLSSHASIQRQQREVVVRCVEAVVVVLMVVAEYRCDDKPPAAPLRGLAHAPQKRLMEGAQLLASFHGHGDGSYRCDLHASCAAQLQSDRASAKGGLADAAERRSSLLRHAHNNNPAVGRSGDWVPGSYLQQTCWSV